MNMLLQRLRYENDGIFSLLMQDNKTVEKPFSICEHAYPSGVAEYTWLPKVLPGEYCCVRGKHRLHGMTEDFETFEITDVLGHSGILLHWGNWNEDSQGCLLVGDAFAKAEHDGMKGVDLVTNSRAAFKRFMDLQLGVSTFQLTVRA